MVMSEVTDPLDSGEFSGHGLRLLGDLHPGSSLSLMYRDDQGAGGRADCGRGLPQGLSPILNGVHP